MSRLDRAHTSTTRMILSAIAGAYQLHPQKSGMSSEQISAVTGLSLAYLQGALMVMESQHFVVSALTDPVVGRTTRRIFYISRRRGSESV